MNWHITYVRALSPAMFKKIAVLALFASIALGLYFLKKELLGSPSASQFIILNWQHTPDTLVVNRPAEFSVRLKDKKNLPIENAQIKIEATMNHSGMIPIYSEASAFPKGIYKFSLVPSMAGDWILFLTITKADKSIIKKEMTFKIESK